MSLPFVATVSWLRNEQYTAHELILFELPKITAGGSQNSVHQGYFFQKCVLVNHDR